MKNVFSILLLLSLASLVCGQTAAVNWRAYNEYRKDWDVTHYDLHVTVNIETKSLSGHNTVRFLPVANNSSNYLQIDLQKPMILDSVISNNQAVSVQAHGDHYLLNSEDIKDSTFTVYFHGIPPVAKRPPWESGFVWTKDSLGNPWVAEACQDLGASMWWPCKDYPKDEVDSMDITITCPKDLKAVSNGRLIQVTDPNSRQRSYHWKVVSPINNYGVNLSVGNYVYFKETITGEKGPLEATYYVLPYHVEQAKLQFLDAPRTIKALEHWFGPYPFYEDGYKLVEVPYLGMEHQSCVTYGNRFKQGYLGRDLSGTGWGLTFDFIIVHESGHEWFANNITHENVADMWIHESFTSYSEALFLEYFYGDTAGAAYIRGIRQNILNDKPIIGNYERNESGSGDMYYKGANMLHTLRHMVNDTELWRKTLRKMNAQFYHQTVSSKTIEGFLAQELNMDLEGFFDQYLRAVEIPTLAYKIKRRKVVTKMTNVARNFKMPLTLKINGEWVTETVGRKKTRWRMNDEIETVEENPDYYIRYQNRSK